MAEFEDPPVTDQESDDNNFVWWLCLLPGLAAAGVFGYQYMAAKSPMFLGYAVASVVASVVFGMLIAGSKGAEEGGETGGDTNAMDATMTDKDRTA
jgi:hypothetical protein